MMVNCPQCLSKSRIAEKKQVDLQKIEFHCQCENIFCGSTFVSELSLGKNTKTIFNQLSLCCCECKKAMRVTSSKIITNKTRQIIIACAHCGVRLAAFLTFKKHIKKNEGSPPSKELQQSLFFQQQRTQKSLHSVSKNDTRKALFLTKKENDQ